jgi:hypothetical protein
MDDVLSAAATTLKKLELHELKTKAKNEKGRRIHILTPAEKPQIEEGRPGSIHFCRKWQSFPPRPGSGLD